MVLVFILMFFYEGAKLLRAFFTEGPNNWGSFYRGAKKLRGLFTVWSQNLSKFQQWFFLKKEKYILTFSFLNPTQCCCPCSSVHLSSLKRSRISITYYVFETHVTQRVKVSLHRNIWKFQAFQKISCEINYWNNRHGP